MAVKQTPLIAQYLSVKQRVPDAILFFRLGDFYEMFFEDAEVGARVLDIQLTSRSKDGVPLCGVPYHAAEPYIAKLIKAGHKVAICEQGAQDKGADGKPRGIMTRQIVRVITPGTVGEETVLVAGEKNYLVAVVREEAETDLTPEPFPQGKGDRRALANEGALSGQVAEGRPHPRDDSPRRPRASGTSREGEGMIKDAAPRGGAERENKTGRFAIAAVDVSTGEFVAARIGTRHGLGEELARLAPREIVFFADDPEHNVILEELGAPITALGPEAAEDAKAALAARFGAAAALDEPIVLAAGAALLYLERNFGHDLAHLAAPAVYQAAEYMMVDETTRRHLELTASSDGARRGSLLSILDETVTAPGARTLANWIVYPMLAPRAIADRHDAVAELFDADLGGAVESALKRIGDLERLAGRLGAMRASPRDCIRLAQALEAAASLREWMRERSSALIRDLAARIAPDPALAALINATLGDEPPVNPRDGNLIRAGYSAEVDELRALASGAREVLARLEVSE
ncbi:MAG: hypothetical protein WA854_03720, partial [Candidatus Binataceae bacterium]